MMFLCELLKEYSKIILPISVCILLTLGITLLKKISKRNKRNKELTRAAADKVRDENLNNAILNNHSRGETKEVYKPYDVDYSNTNCDKGKKSKELSKGAESHVMVQLIEKTELSTRKFMLNPAKKIRIGSDLHDNDIAVLAEGISSHQCEIFSAGDRVYVKNLSYENRTIIKRKKDQAIVDEKGIRLLSNDMIILGQVSYDITIMN